ncbi:MAG: hypothetical protein LBR11_05560, partial [Deltaproteobacteria bacterium]|nr:hypothetical protein [Deltaproteobacteria bacterium]
ASDLLKAVKTPRRPVLGGGRARGPQEQTPGHRAGPGSSFVSGQPRLTSEALVILKTGADRLLTIPTKSTS